MTDKVSEAVVGTARRHVGDGLKVVELSTGYKARIRSVSLHLIFDAQASVDEPQVPVWHNEDKGRDEPNPDDPNYLKALAEYEQQQQLATIDVMTMFGVDVLDVDENVLGAPDDDDWIKKLELRHRLGYSKVDLSVFDLSNQIERDFLWKKYFVVGAGDIPVLLEAYDFLNEDDVQEAERSFRDN